MKYQKSDIRYLTSEIRNMAKNKGRVGAVAGRSQFFNFITSLWQKRDTKTGKIADVKTSRGKFKGVKKEK